MGVQIDRYENLTPIGFGGFSQVYEAWQPKFNRKVAVKVLTLKAGLDIDQQAFELECRAMGSVSEHPHIVTVYDSGSTDDGHPFITMELYQETLQDRILSRGALPIEEVLNIGVLLCGALQRAHDAKILHRDIKPQNIFFSAYGTPALGDFGIASLASDRGSQESAGMSMHYAAPEVIEGERPSVESDLYSLGATLYTALARHRPFHRSQGESDASLIQRIRTDTPPAITAQQVPRRLEAAILGLLVKHRNDRPRSALEVANILREQQTSLGLPATAVPLAEVDFNDDHTTAKSSETMDIFGDDATGGAITSYRAKVSERSTEDYKEPVKSKRGLIAAGVLLSTIVLIGTAVLLSRRGQPQSAPPTTTISAPSTTIIIDRSAPEAPEILDQTTSGDGTEIIWSTPDRADRYLVEFTGSDAKVESVREARIVVAPSEGIICLTVVAVSELGRSGPASESICISP